MKSCNSLVLRSREYPIVFIPNDSEQEAAHNVLQDFISDSHSKPAVVCFPRFHNHYKYGINGKGVKQAL